jgi:hypothetical protein
MAAERRVSDGEYVTPLSLWERVRVRGSGKYAPPSPRPSPRGRGSISFTDYAGALTSFMSGVR